MLYSGETIPLRLESSKFRNMCVLELGQCSPVPVAIHIGVVNYSPQNGLSRVGTVAEVRTCSRITPDLDEEVVVRHDSCNSTLGDMVVQLTGAPHSKGTTKIHN